MLHNPRWAYRQTGPILVTLFERYPGIPQPRKTTPRVIIERVAAWHMLPVSEVLSRRRYEHVIEARFDAIAAVKAAYPAMSYARLGMIFDRDHSTIWHALRKRGMR